MNLKELLSKEWFRLLGVLVIGVTIGAVFYPTKRIEERVSQKYEQQIQTMKEQHVKESAESDEKWLEIVSAAKEKHIQSEKKVVKLQEEVKTLQSKQKTAYYKLIKPDGTIEERSFTESEVNESTKVITEIQEEFKTKIDELENRYSIIHAERVTKIKKEFDSKESEYKKTIEELTKSRVVSINEKSFGVEVGLLSNKNYYGHATMDLWGPVFFGVHGEVNTISNNNLLGVGVGLRF